MTYLAQAEAEEPRVFQTEQGLIPITITADMVSRARQKAAELPRLNNSIRQGEGNFAGFLGEEVCLAAFAGATEQNTYDYDIDLNGIKLEVKTKDRTIRPHLMCAASVAEANTRQHADYYVFVSLYRKADSEDFTEGYVCGFYEKANYRRDAVYLRRGEPEGDNGFIVRQNCYNIPYAALRHSYERLGLDIPLE